MFDLLPNETLEHLFSFLSASHFPLRQTCRLFRDLIPPVTFSDFKDRVYEAGDLALAQSYNLSCSRDNLQTILRKGHEKMFQRQEDKLHFGYAPFAEACVQGRNRYIIDYLFKKGYVLRVSLVYEACIQNYLGLVQDMFIEEIDLYECAWRAVCGEALDVLSWIAGKDESYCSIILHLALTNHKTKVLRWLPVEKVKAMSKRELFISACSAPTMDMFNFLLEIDYIVEQRPSTSVALVKSVHTQMLRNLLEKRDWTLDEEMFEVALEQGCEEMLSCLLELDCVHDDVHSLYHKAKEENLPWLIKNLPLTEDHLLEICMNGPEKVLLHLVREGCLPESFQDDPDITFAALEEGFVSVLEEYVEQEYTFHDDVCLLVNNTNSLDWLIENQINLSSELYYRLVKEMDLSLLKKLEHLVDFPMDLLDYTFTLLREYSSAGDYKNRAVVKLKQIIEWIKAN